METDNLSGLSKHERTKRRFPLADLAGLVDPNRPERVWAWEDVIPEGEHVSIVAPAGIGKSLLALALAVSVARNDDAFIGRELNVPGRVLYIDMENSEDDHSERLRDLGVDLGNVEDIRERLLMLSLPPLSGLDTATGASELWDILDAYEVGAGDLLVLDSTQRIIEGEENSADTFRKLYNHTSRELKRRGITVLRTDNVGHQGTRARGSSGKRDDVGAAWLLKEEEADETFSLIPTKRRSKGNSGSLTFERANDERGRLIFHPTESQYSRKVQAVLDLLEDLGVSEETGQRKAWEAVRAERDRRKSIGESLPAFITARLVHRVQGERGIEIVIEEDPR